MQAAEAITHLIHLGDEELMRNSTYGTDAPEFSPEEETLQVAISIAQAMLNSMIPVARFRVFIRIESGDFDGAEYTVSCTDILSVKAAVRALRLPSRKVYIQLWEQRATGADMLLGFQGSTGDVSQGKRSLDHWLESLSQFEHTPAVN